MVSKEYEVGLKYTQKWSFEGRKQCPNTSQTTPKQLRKSPENDFFDPKYGQKWPLKTVKMSKILTENLDYWGHLSTFGAENTTKSRPFKVENNAQTLPKQLQNNFEKVQKTTFSTPKMAKNDPLRCQKWVIFWLKISIFGFIYGPLELKNTQKCAF